LRASASLIACLNHLGALLRCGYISNGLATSLYTAYYLGSCVPCAFGAKVAAKKRALGGHALYGCYYIPNSAFKEMPKQKKRIKHENP
jgi:hypothetical protein